MTKNVFFFKDDLLEFVITEGTLKFFQRFDSGKFSSRILGLEGPSGSGKSFILYFLTCYLLTLDSYIIDYIPLPKETTKITPQIIYRFVNYYYPGLLEVDDMKVFCDFETHIRFLDTETRKFVLVIDQVNELFKNEANKIFFKRCILESGSLYSPVIFSASANNDLTIYDLSSKNHKRYSERSEFYLSPFLKESNVIEIMMSHFRLFSFPLSSLRDSDQKYLIDQIISITSGNPLRIFQVVGGNIEKLLECIKTGDDTRNSARAEIDKKKLEFLMFNCLEKFKKQNFISFTSFGEKIEKEFKYYLEYFKNSKRAIFYEHTVPLSQLVYDKNLFYPEPLEDDPIQYFIRPIYKECRELVIDKSVFDDYEETIAFMCTILFRGNQALIGTAVEKYFWLHAHQQRVIKLTPFLRFKLSSVEFFYDIPKKISLSGNTCYIPISPRFPYYDGFCTCWRNSELFFFAIQITISTEPNVLKKKLRRINDAFSNGGAYIVLQKWFPALASLNSTRIHFCEVFLYPKRNESIESDSDFRDFVFESFSESFDKDYFNGIKSHLKDDRSVKRKKTRKN